jgi:hypothetical protein
MFFSRITAFIRFETHRGSSRARTCLQGDILKTVKSVGIDYLLHWHLLSTLIFRARRSRATIDGVEKGNRHTSVLVPLSAFMYTRKLFTPAVQECKNAYLQQANALGCGRNISLDPLS